MRSRAILGGLASILLATATTVAQQTGDVPIPQSPPPAQQPSPGAQWREQTLPLLALILRERASLGLSSSQVEGIERLIVDFAREAIRRQADWLVAMLDLATMVEPDDTDPAKPVDLARVEIKIREIERIGGDLELTRLRAIEAGKAQLTAEQRAKLRALITSDDPPAPGDVIPAAAHSGGGGPGHPGGGRPGGGVPGHPGGGAPGHPGGGGGGRPPAWHGGRPPVHHPSFHPGIHHPGFVGVWPWYWSGYSGPVYTPPPPPPAYWYYCLAYGAYYPDAPSCPEPWVVVPAG